MPCDERLVQEHTAKLAMMETTLRGLADTLMETRQHDLKGLEERLNAMFQNGPMSRAQTAIAVLQSEVTAVRTTVERGFERLSEDFKTHIETCPPRIHPTVSEVAKGKSRWRYLPLWAYVLIGAGLVLGSDFLRRVGGLLIENIVAKMVP